MESTGDENVDLAVERISNNSTSDKEIEEAISTLATTSRSTPAVRPLLSRPPILAAFIRSIERGLQDSNKSLVSAALRCLGNACIDNDEARQTVTDLGFLWARGCLEAPDDDLQNLTVLVLTNVCMDFEPAQKRCFEEEIHFLLIGIVARVATAEDRSDGHYSIELLFKITGQKAAAKKPKTEAEQELPSDVVKKLLSLPWLHRANPNDHDNEDDSGTDDDDFATILEIVSTFLRDPVIQKQVVLSQSVNSVWQMLLLNEKRIAALSPVETDDIKKLLISMSTSLTWCLSDMAANPEFSKRYPTLSDPVPMAPDLIPSVEETIDVVGNDDAIDPKAWHNDRTASAACQILGNLLWALPVEDSSPYVLEKKIHEPLWQLVASNTSADLMHSAAGLLIQLTRPSVECRDEIGSVYEAHAALELLCEHETEQLKKDGISLLRSLGKDCKVNQERFDSLARGAMETLSAAANPLTSSEERVVELSN